MMPPVKLELPVIAANSHDSPPATKKKSPKIKTVFRLLAEILEYTEPSFYELERNFSWFLNGGRLGFIHLKELADGKTHHAGKDTGGKSFDLNI